MIRLEKLRLFPFKTFEIYFPGVQLTDTPVNFVFFPENSNFNLAYRKLKIQRRFCRYGTVLPALNPRLIYNKEIISQYMLFKMLPIRKFVPSIRNVFVDTTHYLTKLDARYKRDSYRRPVVLSKFQDYVRSIGQQWPARQNIMIYYVDTTQPIDPIIQKKRGWVLVDCFKRGDFLGMDYVLLCVYDGRKTTYYMIKSPTMQLPWVRVYSILQQLKHRVDSHTLEQAVDEISDDVVVTSTIDKQDLINNEIDTTTKSGDVRTADVKSVEIRKSTLNNIDSTERIRTVNLNQVDRVEATPNLITKDLVKQFLNNRPTLTNLLRTQPITPYTSKKIVLTSILDRNLRNPQLIKKVVNNIQPQNYQKAIDNLKRTVVPNILPHDKYENNARQYVYCDSHINDVNEHKNPSALLNKRKIDFNKNFEQDLINSFQLLSKKTKYPLYLKSIKPEMLPVDPGNLRPTISKRYNIVLMDERKREHNISIDIPQIQPDGTFIINGSKKFMMYQLIIDPIFFLKKGEGKLQTAYSTITTFHKRTKYKSYFQCYVTGYNIPMALLLTYHIGFDSMCKLFGIRYQKTTTDAVAGTRNYTIEFLDGTCFYFPDYVDRSKIPEHCYCLLESIREIVGVKSADEFFNNNALADMFVRQTQNRNSLFKIDQTLKNIMEPIAVEVLKAKLLPTTLPKCLLYIAMNIAKGRVDARNDISKQRIRCSEVMTYQIQKQILASYSQYQIDREHGNEDAKYFCDTQQIIQNIVNPSTSKLMREIDNANPYDELSCLTSCTPVGDGGVQNADGISVDARNIHDSYYGNIDAMDTPEGGNVGIVNHLTIDALIGNNRGSFGKAAPGEDKGVGSLGVCSCVVPYVNHNDGCRIMFSASQGRQAIPIIGNEKPLVQTGYETILTSMLSDSFIKKAQFDGVVTKVTENSITVVGKDGKTTQVAELDHPILKTSVGQIKGSSNTFHNVVKVGQRVTEGQILAEGKHIKDGVISVGSNLLVAMMGWKGFGFEDGYVISESVANGKFTSTSYEEKEVLIGQDDNVKFIAESGTFTKSGDTLLVRSSKDIEQILGMEADEIVDGQHILKSPGGKIIEIAIYPNISINKFPVLVPEFMKFKQKYEETKGAFPKTKFYNAKSGDSTPFKGIRIVFRIERYDTCVLGDKISNNHGGKGTLALIEKDANMPVTPWGERVDLLFNPLAVINRMNPGTIYELYTGLIAKCLARRFVQYGYNKNDKAIGLASTVYSMMDNTKNKVLSSNLIKSLKSLTPQKYTQFVNSIIDDNYVMPIYVPQFKEPTQKMIMDTMKYLGLKKSYYLTLPEYKSKTLEPVAVGYLYYKKLEQQASYKQSVRSVGRYNQQTGQATQGKAQGGGQRLSEMDTWCLISHGAESTLKELMGPLADDSATKQEMISDIINNGYTTYKEPKKSPSTDRLKIYLLGTMIQTDL